jgi:hypothetical protein
VTLAPLSDSLSALEQSETNEDDIPEEAIELRFLKPYFESSGAVKLGNILFMVDENGKKLEFQVTNVELEGSDKEREKKDGGKSKEKESDDADNEISVAGLVDNATNIILSTATPRPSDSYVLEKYSTVRRGHAEVHFASI